MMDKRMKVALDRYITGNYGEDSISIEEERGELKNNYTRVKFYMPQYAEFKGWVVDVKIRKEKGLKRYVGNMIIYDKDLKRNGIFRTSFIISEKSIVDINKEVMKFFKEVI